MLGWFSKKEKVHLKVDIHSHLLPGIDDGVNSFEESISILKAFEQLGFKKLITTPHIYKEYYPNTREIILDKLSLLQEKVEEAKLGIRVEAAAEYFMDEHLIELLGGDSPLLSFGQFNYVLIETAFYTRPIIFDETIFKLKSKGYTPVLAHPERYYYLEKDLGWLKKIRENGVKLQVSLPSLRGAYGPEVKDVARRLTKEHMVDFLGSDIHRRAQMSIVRDALNMRLIPQNLLNESLL